MPICGLHRAAAHERLERLEPRGAEVGFGRLRAQRVQALDLWPRLRAERCKIEAPALPALHLQESVASKARGRRRELARELAPRDRGRRNRTRARSRSGSSSIWVSIRFRFRFGNEIEIEIDRGDTDESSACIRQSFSYPLLLSACCSLKKKYNNKTQSHQRTCNKK